MLFRGQSTNLAGRPNGGIVAEKERFQWLRASELKIHGIINSDSHVRLISLVPLEIYEE